MRGLSMFSYKMFREGEDVLLAICDADIVGKHFQEGELTIALAENFYSEKECKKPEAVKLAKEATIINAVGNDIVNLLIDEKIVNRSNVLKIGKVLHAQVVSVW
jgi:hypothetical protein